MYTYTLAPKRHHIPFLVLGIVALVCSVGLVLTVLQHAVPATSGNIYLKDETISANKNEPVNFTVRISPGAQIDTVTATIKYNSSRLRYEKTEYNDSPFSSQIPATKTADTVTVQSAKLGGDTVSTDAYVATVRFIALEPGAQTVSLTSGNAARAGQATNPTVMGKIITPDTVAQNQAAAIVKNSNSATNETPPQNNIVKTITSPVALLLQNVGVSKAAAARISPWIIGLLLCGIIAIVIMLIRKKKLSQPSAISEDVTNE